MHEQKKSRQKLKYLENEKSFRGEIKSIFKGISVAKNCLRRESVPLKFLNRFSKQSQCLFDLLNPAIVWGHLNVRPG